MRVLFAIVVLCVVSSALAAPEMHPELVKRVRSAMEARQGTGTGANADNCASGCVEEGDSTCLLSGPAGSGFENGVCVLNDDLKTCCNGECCVYVPPPPPEPTVCDESCDPAGDQSCNLAGPGFPQGVCLLDTVNPVCCNGGCCSPPPPPPNYCTEDCVAEGDMSTTFAGPGFPSGICVLNPVDQTACKGSCCQYDEDNLLPAPANPDLCAMSCGMTGDSSCFLSGPGFENGICALEATKTQCCNAQCCIPNTAPVPTGPDGKPIPANACKPDDSCMPGGDNTCVLSTVNFANGICALNSDGATSCCNESCCAFIPGYSGGMGPGGGSGSGGTAGTGM